jgi:cytochrome b561
MQEVTRYPLTLRVLHWLIASALMCMVAMGWYISELGYEHPDYMGLLQAHRTVGLCLFPLGVMHLIAYATLPRPPFSASVIGAQRLLARLMHYFLLYVTIAIPVAGYLMSGDKLTVLGNATVPALVVLSKALRSTLFEVHATLAWTTAVMAVLHAGAAVRHHLVDKDDTLRKML